MTREADSIDPVPNPDAMCARRSWRATRKRCKKKRVGSGHGQGTKLLKSLVSNSRRGIANLRDYFDTLSITRPNSARTFAAGAHRFCVTQKGKAFTGENWIFKTDQLRAVGKLWCEVPGANPHRGVTQWAAHDCGEIPRRITDRS